MFVLFNFWFQHSFTLLHPSQLEMERVSKWNATLHKSINQSHQMNNNGRHWYWRINEIFRPPDPFSHHICGGLISTHRKASAGLAQADGQTSLTARKTGTNGVLPTILPLAQDPLGASIIFGQRDYRCEQWISLSVNLRNGKEIRSKNSTLHDGAKCWN